MPRKNNQETIIHQATLGNLLIKGVPAVKSKQDKSDLSAVSVAVLMEALAHPPEDNMSALGDMISKALKFAYHAGKNS